MRSRRLVRCGWPWFLSPWFLSPWFLSPWFLSPWFLAPWSLSRGFLTPASPAQRLLAPGFLRHGAQAAYALFLVAGLLASCPETVLATERIESFHSEVDVQRNGDLVVTETIVVHAQQQDIRHGIYRDFPLTFTDAQGQLRRVSFELLGVQRDGAEEPHFERENDAGLRIYIGDQNAFLPPGRHRYQLRYRTGRQLRFLADHVELDWNVTGNDWLFPIDATTARVQLPDDARPVRWIAYTGRSGERGRSWRAGPDGSGALEFATTRALAPGEGLTIVVQLPDGAVAAPTRTQELRWVLLDHGRSILALSGLLAVFVFYLTAWNAVGRDPPKGSIIARFHPPEGVSPALAAYLHQWGWSDSWREWTATAVSLAVKGMIVFDDVGGLRLERTGQTAPSSGALGTGERSLLQWIDGHGGRVTVDRSSGASLSTAEAAFRDAIERENRGRYFRRNQRWFWAGMLLTGLCIALLLGLGRLTEGEISVTVLTAFVGFFLGSAMARALRAALTRRDPKRKVVAILRLAVFTGILLSVAAQLLPSMMFDPDQRSAYLHAFIGNAFPIALIGSFGLLNAVFWYLLRAPTVAGRQLMDEIEGLGLYLRTAESARMNLRDAPEFTTTHFERLLPYAIALGLEKPWSQAFEAAFVRAHPGQSMQTGYQPGWHANRGWRDSGGFGSSMTAAMGAAQGAFASSVPAPSSADSGFSGGGGSENSGGGSGGGGGGGGGGGW